jgi:hypothetical protein
MRAALLIEKDMCDPSHRRYAFVSALRSEFPGAELFPTKDDHAAVLRRIAERRSEFDVLVTFAYFRQLQHTANALRSIQLPVVVVEHDAYGNYVETSSRRGEFSRFLLRGRIELMAVSGRRHCERLRAEGHSCIYLPKAAPAHFLTERNHHSGTFCAFGSVSHPVYARRAALFRELQTVSALDPLPRGDRSEQPSTGPVVHNLRFEFVEMPSVLARYSGCVICDLGLEEPMAKHFEVAALGLAPIRDDEVEAELNDLGYRDGESMIVYRSKDDLIDKLDHYRRHEEELRRIQAGARAASRRHTWEERARALSEVVSRRFPAR